MKSSKRPFGTNRHGDIIGTIVNEHQQSARIVKRQGSWETIVKDTQRSATIGKGGLSEPEAFADR
jgi:hypothetical protein